MLFEKLEVEMRVPSCLVLVGDLFLVCRWCQGEVGCGWVAGVGGKEAFWFLIRAQSHPGGLHLMTSAKGPSPNTTTLGVRAA